MVLRGMRSAKVLMSCRSSWATSEPYRSRRSPPLAASSPLVRRPPPAQPRLPTAADCGRTALTRWVVCRVFAGAYMAVRAHLHDSAAEELWPASTFPSAPTMADGGRWAVATDSRACAKVRTGARRRRRRRTVHAAQNFRAPAARAQRMRLNERLRA
jgi:hypothetical protein